MEVHLDVCSLARIRDAANAARGGDDPELLRDTILVSLPGGEAEAVERRLDDTKLKELVGEIAGSWEGGGLDDIFRVLRCAFAQRGVELELERCYALVDDVEDEDEEPTLLDGGGRRFGGRWLACVMRSPPSAPWSEEKARRLRRPLDRPPCEPSRHIAHRRM